MIVSSCLFGALRPANSSKLLKILQYSSSLFTVFGAKVIRKYRKLLLQMSLYNFHFTKDSMQLEEKDILGAKNSLKKGLKKTVPFKIQDVKNVDTLVDAPKAQWALPVFKKEWVSVIEKAFEWCLYGLVFLVPLFFLPITADALELNKQALLSVGTFVMWLLFAAKTVMSQKIELKGSPFYWGLGALFIAWLLASFSSLYPANSFAGFDQQEYASFSTLAACVALVVILVHTVTERVTIAALVALLISIGLSSLVGIAQLFGKFLLPWDFTKNTAFTPIGSYDLWGTLVAIGLLIAVSLIIRLSLTEHAQKQTYSILLAIFIGLSLISLFLLDDWRLWVGVIIGLALNLGFLYAKLPKDRAVAWLILPSFVIVLATVLSVVHVQRFVPLPSTAQPSFKTSAQLAWDTLTRAPLFGYGPGNFITSYTQFKPQAINTYNTMNLWGVRFTQGGSSLFTAVAAVGIIGTLAILFCVLFFGFLIVRSLLQKKFDDEYLSLLGLSAGLAGLAFLALLKPSNMATIFVMWLFIGLLAARLQKTSIQLTSAYSNRFLILSSLLLSFVCVLGLVGGILMGQRYGADIAFANGLTLDQKLSRQLASGKPLDQKDVEKLMLSFVDAYSGNPSNDLYARTLSQGALYRVQQVAQNPNEKDGLATLQSLASAAIDSAKRAADLNPRDVRNLENLASVYQQIAPYTSGADVFAIEAYKKASELDPKNPVLKVSLARVYLESASLHLKKMQTEKDESIKASEKQTADTALQNADRVLLEAVTLKSDLPSAYYFLAVTRANQNKKEEAIQNMDKALTLNASLDPRTMDTSLFYLGSLLYANLGEKEKATQVAKLSLSVKPNDQSSLWLYANLIADTDKAAALTSLQKILELDPSNQQVIDRIKELRGEKTTEAQPEKMPIAEEPTEQNGVPAEDEETTAPAEENVAPKE